MSSVIPQTTDEVQFKSANNIDWNNEHIKIWRRAAEEKQAFYCATLGSTVWEEYTREQEFYLKLKIGFSLYGPPPLTEIYNTEEGVLESHERALDLFFKEPIRKKEIEKLTGIIQKEWKSDKLCLAFIFVIAWVNEEYTEFPVIRLLRGEEELMFIDSIGRVYKDWRDFLRNNQYRRCVYCYPAGGCYRLTPEGRPDLEFGRSPTSRALFRIGRNVDVCSSAVGLGTATLLTCGVLLPLSAPLIAGAAATGLAASFWITCRSVAQMTDRQSHCQSLALTDPGGRSCWISLAVGILGAASTGAIQYTQFLARNGKMLIKVADLSSIGITSIGIINHLVGFVQNNRFKNCCELTVSVLFFCHCSISLKTAQDIVLEIENRMNVGAEAVLGADRQSVLANLLMDTKRVGIFEGNGSLVRSLKIIKTKDSFFQEFGSGGA